VGENVTLPCRPHDNTAVDWSYHKSVYVSHPKIIYTENAIQSEYQGRYFVSNASDGDYDLLIIKVQPNDSGIFICAEHNGLGPQRFVELIVSGGFAHICLISIFI